MKEFYQKYVNGQGIEVARYLAFPFGSGIRPESLLRKAAPAGFAPEFEVEACDRIASVPRELSTIHSLLLHGSQASNDVMPFSDVDVVAVLDDSRIHTPSAIKHDIFALRRFCRWMFRKDPLMHHGLMFIGLSEFSRYDESFLPIATFMQAKSIYGSRRIKISNANPEAALNAAKQLRSSLYWLCRYDFQTPYFQQDYSLKEFISGILLLPARYLGSTGQFVKKRDSFAIAYTKFPQIGWRPVQCAEEIRAKWMAPHLHPLHRIGIDGLSAKAQSLGRYFYKRNFQALRGCIQSLQDEVKAMKATLDGML